MVQSRVKPAPQARAIELRAFPLSANSLAHHFSGSHAKKNTISRERELLYEQIVYAYREYLPGAIPAFLGGILLVAVMWQEISHSVLLAWLAVLYTATAIRTYWSFKFNREQPSIDDIERWRSRFVIGSCGAGAIWGASAF